MLAVPAHALASLPLPPDLAQLIEPLSRLTHPPVTSWTLSFRREDVAHPLDGFGLLVPTVAKRRLLGVLFPSTLFPGRAADGTVTLAAFIGGCRQPELARLPPEELRPVVLEELAILLGVRGEPAWEHPTAWAQAIPQYNLGYGELIAAAARAEAAFPTLALVGNYRGGIALGNCLTNGLETAQRLLPNLPR